MQYLLMTFLNVMRMLICQSAQVYFARSNRLTYLHSVCREASAFSYMFSLHSKMSFLYTVLQHAPVAELRNGLIAYCSRQIYTCSAEEDTIPYLDASEANCAGFIMRWFREARYIYSERQPTHAVYDPGLDFAQKRLSAQIRFNAIITVVIGNIK